MTRVLAITLLLCSCSWTIMARPDKPNCSVSNGWPAADVVLGSSAIGGGVALMSLNTNDTRVMAGAGAVAAGVAYLLSASSGLDYARACRER